MYLVVHIPHLCTSFTITFNFLLYRVYVHTIYNTKMVLLWCYIAIIIQLICGIVGLCTILNVICNFCVFYYTNHTEYNTKYDVVVVFVWHPVYPVYNWCMVYCIYRYIRYTHNHFKLLCNTINYIPYMTIKYGVVMVLYSHKLYTWWHIQYIYAVHTPYHTHHVMYVRINIRRA